MKGIVLAGGLGTRLGDLTKATNKHLLPVYDKPMVYYPIKTLVDSGVKDIMVISSGPHAGDFFSILKNGEDFGLNTLHYGYQWKPDGGIADALSIAREFAGNDNICVILGDNTTDADISDAISNFNSSIFVNDSFVPKAHVFLKEVKDPERYGVAEIADHKFNGMPAIKRIIEKPKDPPSKLAVTGLYLYDKEVWNFVDQCSPSERGELEITDVNNMYIKNGRLTYSELQGYWKDAGTFDSLYEVNEYYYNKANKK